MMLRSLQSVAEHLESFLKVSDYCGLGCSLHFYSSSDSIAQPGLRTSVPWPLAIFSWLVALSKVVTRQALLYPNVCPSRPWARVNGCLNNSVEGCYTLGYYQKPNYNCTGGNRTFVFNVNLHCPIAKHGYFNLN